MIGANFIGQKRVSLIYKPRAKFRDCPVVLFSWLLSPSYPFVLHWQTHYEDNAIWNRLDFSANLSWQTDQHTVYCHNYRKFGSEEIIIFPLKIMGTMIGLISSSCINKPVIASVLTQIEKWSKNSVYEPSRRTCFSKCLGNSCKGSADCLTISIQRRIQDFSLGALMSNAGAFLQKWMRKRTNWVPWGEGSYRRGAPGFAAAI